jgi:hypothetical protein
VNLDEKLELLGEILEPHPLDGLDPETLLRAVGHAYESLAAQGEAPEEDKWLVDRDLFLRIAKPLIATAWRETTDSAAGALPWDDNTLVRAWLEWGGRRLC